MTAAQKTEPKTRESTYHVFKAADIMVEYADGDPVIVQPGWGLVAENVKAANPADAIRKHAEANKDATDLAGEYVAVAAARWNPIPVGATTQVVLTFGTNGSAEEGEQS